MTGKATSSQNNASEAGSLSLDQSVAVLPGIGEKRAELLRNLEVVTVRDLLFHFPRNYEDRRRPCPIARLKDGDPAPLLRLAVQEGVGLPPATEFSLPLFVATSCSDARLPWTSAQTPQERRNALAAAIAAVPPAAYAPFPTAVPRLALIHH